MELMVTQAVRNSFLALCKLLVVIRGPDSLNLSPQVITQSQGVWESAVFSFKIV